MDFYKYKQQTITQCKSSDHRRAARTCFQRCRHLLNISVLVFNMFGSLACSKIRVFSVRQSLHFLEAGLYGGARFATDHLMLGDLPFSFYCQKYDDKVVSFLYFSCLNDLR